MLIINQEVSLHPTHQILPFINVQRQILAALHLKDMIKSTLGIPNGLTQNIVHGSHVMFGNDINSIKHGIFDANTNRVLGFFYYGKGHSLGTKPIANVLKYRYVFAITYENETSDTLQHALLNAQFALKHDVDHRGVHQVSLTQTAYDHLVGQNQYQYQEGNENYHWLDSLETVCLWKRGMLYSDDIMRLIRSQ